MTRSHSSSARGAQRGFSLIEGLVSILIFSFGVLALVGLQANSIQQSNNAKYRSDASMLANALLGRMWVTDRSNAALQSFVTGGTGYTSWLADVQTALPLAAANAPAVSVDADNIVTVNIYWKAPNEAAANAQHAFTAVAQVK